MSADTQHGVMPNIDIKKMLGISKPNLVLPKGNMRNRPCPCGSRAKYKNCHFNEDRKKALPKLDYTKAMLIKENQGRKQYGTV